LRKICPEIDSPNPMGGKGHEIAPFDPGDDAFSAEFSKTHGVPMGLRGLAGRKVGMGRWALNLEGGGELVNGIKDLFEGAGEDATKLNNTKYFPEMFGGTGATPKIGLSPYEEYAKPSFLPDLNGETAAALEQRQFAQFQQIMDPNTLTGRIYAGLQPEYQRAMFNNFKGGADRTALQNQALEWASNGGGPNPLAYHSGPANLSAGRPQGPSSAYSPGLGLESPEPLAAEGVAPVLLSPGTASQEEAAAATAGRPLQDVIDQNQRGSAFKASDPRFSPWLTGGLIAGGVGLAGGAALGSSAISDNRDANTVQGSTGEMAQIQQQYSVLSRALDAITPQFAQVSNQLDSALFTAAKDPRNQNYALAKQILDEAQAGNPEKLDRYEEMVGKNVPIIQQHNAIQNQLAALRNRAQSLGITSNVYGGPNLAPLPASTPGGEMNALGMEDFNNVTDPRLQASMRAFRDPNSPDAAPATAPQENMHTNMQKLDPGYTGFGQKANFSAWIRQQGGDLRQALSLPSEEFNRRFPQWLSPQERQSFEARERGAAQSAAGILYTNSDTGQPVYGTPQSGPPLERSRGNPFGPA
jgi:hypothetical protein